MGTMRSIKLTARGKLEMFTEQVPEPENPDDVLIKVDAVGICGSDVHYFNTGRIGNQVIDFPFTVGHEFAGTVVKTGSGCIKVKPGDRVAVDPLIYCGTCTQCRSGRFHTCLDQKFLGCPGQMEGCLREYLVLPEFTCYPLSDSIDQVTAALCEPLAIGCYAASRASSMNGRNVGILGAGPIGLSVLLMAKLDSPDTITMLEPLEYRRQAALEHGANWARNPDDAGIVRDISQSVPELLDTVFECCGKQEALDHAFELVKPGGEIIIVGIPEFDHFSFEAHQARRKEITIKHIRRQNESEVRTLQLTAEGLVDPGFMATHFFHPEQVQDAFELVSEYRDEVIKAVVMFRD